MKDIYEKIGATMVVIGLTLAFIYIDNPIVRAIATVLSSPMDAVNKINNSEDTQNEKLFLSAYTDLKSNISISYYNFIQRDKNNDEVGYILISLTNKSKYKIGRISIDYKLFHDGQVIYSEKNIARNTSWNLSDLDNCQYGCRLRSDVLKNTETYGRLQSLQKDPTIGELDIKVVSFYPVDKEINILNWPSMKSAKR